MATDQNPIKKKSVATDILFGCVNGVMVIPIAISFCSIIFRHPAFLEFIPSLVKLVLFSCAIHQISFCLFSSLPFAIGQVQDAGLIFLSTIAASVAQTLGARGDTDAIIPTTLFTLGICTALLGGMLIIVAKLKLASAVQYLPMPVVGGYLAFIGFFCGLAGLSVMTGVEATNIVDLPKFCHEQSLILLLPGLLIGIFTYFLMDYWHSPYILPGSLVFVLVAFYFVLFLTGTSLQDARDMGWVAPLVEVKSTFEAWSYYDLSKFHWDLLPNQFFTWFAMFLVVSFASSLDVAAVEMELGAPLDYNHELKTVGISNLISGLCGGYTGSYIFSQTIFSMRRGITSTISGYIVAGIELLLVLLPISITSYVPKMFFGSLLILIATDLMVEWLIIARAKMMLSEYLVCLFTFFAIHATGIEVGMLLGIIAATLSFVMTYSKLQSVSEASLKSSTVIRKFEERALLLATRGKIVTVSFGGYIFFGSSVQVLEQIKSKLVLSFPLEPTPPPSPPSERVINSDQISGIKKPPSLAIPSITSHLPILEKKPFSTIYEEREDIEMGGEPHYDELSRLLGQPHRGSVSPINASQQSKGYGALENSYEDDTLPQTRERAPSLKMVYKSGSPRGTHPSDSQQLTRDEYQAADHELGHGTHGNTAHHHQPHPTLTFQSVYDLTPNQIQQQYQQWRAEEKKHQQYLKRQQELATLVVEPISSDFVLTEGDNGEKTSSPEHWVVGDDLENGKSGTEEQSGSRITPPADEKPTDKTLTTLPKELTERHNSSDTSASLVDLVWKSKALKRERAMRSMSDLSDDTVLLQTSTMAGSRGRLPSESPNTSTIHRKSITPLEDRRAQTPDRRSLPRSSSYNAIANISTTPEFSGRKRYSLSSSDTNSMPLLSKLHRLSDSMTSNEEVVTEYLVLDFSEVKGIDATAAKSCFLTLVRLMRTANVKLIFASLSTEQEKLLRSHRVLDMDSIVIPDIDDALEWCEDQVIASLWHRRPVQRQSSSATLSSPSKQLTDYVNASRHRQQQSKVKTPRSSFSIGERDSSSQNIMNDLLLTAEETDSLRLIFEDYLEVDTSLLASVEKPMMAPTPSGMTMMIDASLKQVSALLTPTILSKYFTRVMYPAYHLIYDIEDVSDKVYFIEEGHVELVTMSALVLEQAKRIQQQLEQQHPSPPPLQRHRSLSLADLEPPSSGINTNHTSSGATHTKLVKRVNKVCAGGIFGESDFFLARSHNLRAYTTSDCKCWTLTREKFAIMEKHHPQLCMLVYYTMVKSLSIASTCSMYALHPTTASTAREE